MSFHYTLRKKTKFSLSNFNTAILVCWPNIITYIPFRETLCLPKSSQPQQLPIITMHASTKLLASLAAAAQVAVADYGYQFSNALSTGPVAENSFIREANTTLVLPDVNSPQTGNLALWPGMGTSGGDLIQGLAISNTGGTSGCSAAGKGVWCIVASTLESKTRTEALSVPSSMDFGANSFPQRPKKWATPLPPSLAHR